MKINDIYESTTSGSVATVAQPMTGGALKRVGQGVYGKEKGGNLLTGKKTSKKYANSLAEAAGEFAGEKVYVVYVDGKPSTKSKTEKDANDQIAIMRKKNPDKKYTVKQEVREAGMPAPILKNKQKLAGMTDAELAVHLKDKSDDELKQMAWRHGYGKLSPHYVNRVKKGKEINEDELQEDDLILIPGQGRSQKTGFMQHDPDRAEHEGETLKNSLRTIVRVASDLNKRLENQDNFPEWVSEKVGAVKSMMTSVMQYLASEQEAGHDLAEHEMADTRTSMNRTGDEVTSEHDEAYATLKRIAPRIYRFIRNEAPMPIDPIQTLQYLRRIGGNEGQMLSMFKSQIASDTKKQYGDDHPSLAESMRRFLNNLLNESTGGVIAGGGVGEGLSEGKHDSYNLRDLVNDLNNYVGTDAESVLVTNILNILRSNYTDSRGKNLPNREITGSELMSLYGIGKNKRGAFMNFIDKVYSGPKKDDQESYDSFNFNEGEDEISEIKRLSGQVTEGK